MAARKGAWQDEILDIMRQKAGPMSAYDVLEALRSANPRIAPPSVYRALTGLQKRGLVHRLESLNAFVACQCDDHQDESILSICDDCGSVEENVEPGVLANLDSLLAKSGFSAQRHVIEVHGRCAACGDDPQQGAR